jgi:salicylate hydroxylase
LKAKVPEGIIQLKKKLVLMEDLGADGVRLTFEDGEVAIADLVIGADGIRSVRHAPFESGGLCWKWNLFFADVLKVVRDHIFPDHKIKFTGMG